MILVIDNYDSFTYNLVQAFGSMGAELIVRRNDEITPREVEGLRPKGIIISPGPGSPSRAGVSCDIIAAYAGRIPILGVSLGHHCVGAVYGARVMPASKVMHGKTAEVHHDGGPRSTREFRRLLPPRATTPKCSTPRRCRRSLR